jgi:hypothetical protein
MTWPKLFFVPHEGAQIKVKLPEDQRAESVSIGIDCPECKKPLQASGTNKRIAPDDRAYESDAICIGCNKMVGTLRLVTNTLFGLREDEAVLRGRCRVY